MFELNTLFEPQLLKTLIRFFIVATVFTIIEQLFALRRNQPILRRGYGTDVLHYFVSRLLINLGMALLAVVLNSIASHSAWLIPLRQWVAALPVGIQIPLALTIVFFFDYWDHRLAHTWEWRWRFHAIHHSSTEMDWLASVRNHPLDPILRRTITFMPVLMLNFPVLQTLIPVFAAANLQGIFEHVNARITFPSIINRLLATPQFHHWHHALEPKDKNFGAISPIMDLIFDTYYVPKKQWPSEYGIETQIPQTYWGHLVAPFGYRSLWSKHGAEKYHGNHESGNQMPTT
jgi:sterol desaturase/sphingolipid hydroxylase (fatty acid hydroxylase superfamily)